MFIILEQSPGWLSLGLHQGLARTGRDVLVLTPEDVVSRLLISYEITNDEISLEMSFGDLSFCGDELDGVYSGIDSFPPALWPYFSQKDAAYAAMECQSLWLSILSSIRVPVVNRPGIDALAGRLLSRIELYDLARRFGIGIPTIFEAESGREAANLTDAHNLSFIDRGEKFPTERDVSRQALLSEPVRDNQVSIREFLPGVPVSIILVEKKAFLARPSKKQEAWTAMKSSEAPAGLLARLADLHHKTGLTVAEYIFTVSRENLWTLTSMQRMLTDGTPPVHRDRIISEIISLFAAERTSRS